MRIQGNAHIRFEQLGLQMRRSKKSRSRATHSGPLFNL
jgi:hypothetical protein